MLLVNHPQNNSTFIAEHRVGCKIQEEIHSEEKQINRLHKVVERQVVPVIVNDILKEIVR